MSGLFSKPKTPEAPKPVEMPQAPVVDQQAVDREAGDALKRRRGRAATMLTNTTTGAGAVESGSVATKTLLGQ